MANEPEPEVIQQQMAETRAALTEKLETLEQQVVGTVQGATTAVTETVENVKEAVQETVEAVKGSVQETVATVKETFDLPRQVDRHPWLMLGGSVAVGFLAGSVLGRERWSAPSSPTWSALQPNGGFPAQESRSSLLSGLGDVFSPELNRLKGLAIGTVLGVVRDMIVRSAAPQLGPRLGEVVDNITVKLGGQPVSGPILEGSWSEWFQSPREQPERAWTPGAACPAGTAHEPDRTGVGATR